MSMTHEYSIYISLCKIYFAETSQGHPAICEENRLCVAGCCKACGLKCPLMLQVLLQWKELRWQGCSVKFYGMFHKHKGLLTLISLIYCLIYFVLFHCLYRMLCMTNLKHLHPPPPPNIDIWWIFCQFYQ